MVYPTQLDVHVCPEMWLAQADALGTLENALAHLRRHLARLGSDAWREVFRTCGTSDTHKNTKTC